MGFEELGLDGLIDRDNLVCTFCGAKPVVGLTFAVDAEISPETINRELVKNSIVATCKEHLPILQEQFEKEMGEAEFLGEIGGDSDA